MRSLVAAVALAASLAGCTDPYSNSTPSRIPGEQPTTHPVPDPPARAHAPTVTALVSRAVDLSGNWTGPELSQRYAQLARISVGDARRQARDAAARASTDRELSRPDSHSTATLETFVRRDDNVLILTHETLSVAGHRTRRYRVTRATVRRVAGGWVLATWDPQP